MIFFYLPIVCVQVNILQSRLFYTEKSATKMVVELWKLIFPRLILAPWNLEKKSVLLVDVHWLPNETQFSIAIDKTWNLSRRAIKLDNSSIIKDYIVEAIIYPACRIHSHLNFSLEVSVYLITSSDHEQTTNRRMMTYLFPENWTPVNHTLVCFSENRIEGFLHFDVGERKTKSEAERIFEFVFRLLALGSFLQKARGINVAFCQSL